MEEIKRVIFAAGSGTSRAPMAAAIMKQMTEGKDIDVLARGVVVLFPEPMNQKTEAVLISNGIAPDNFAAEQLTAADIVPGTLILTMDEAQRVKVIEEIEGADEDNTFVLSTYVGDEIEVVDPYGASLQTYGLCFEVLKKSIEKLLAKLETDDKGGVHLSLDSTHSCEARSTEKIECKECISAYYCKCSCHIGIYCSLTC